MFYYISVSLILISCSTRNVNKVHHKLVNSLSEGQKVIVIALWLMNCEALALKYSCSHDDLLRFIYKHLKKIIS